MNESIRNNVPNLGGTVISSAEARLLLRVNAPLVVVHTSPTGKLIGEEGDIVDARQAVPWVWQRGPFGSWPCMLATAEAEFATHPKFEYVNTMRIGWAVLYDGGFGFAAKAPVKVGGGE